MNNFNGIISKDFLHIFSNAIDALLEPNSLSVPCTLHYNNGSQSYCNNCIYDQITKTSANIYNGTGPISFTEYTICPVCMGLGLINSGVKEEVLHLAVIFDSKYFVNVSNNMLNISDGTIQTLCAAQYIPKIRSATELTVNISKEYTDHTYERIGDPNPMGLGNTNYIMTFWKRK